jgi:hypothetical protein
MLPTNGKHIGFDDFLDELKRALRERKPYCFTRYGDGEGLILGYPKFTKEENFEKRVNKWFSVKPMPPSDRITFGEQIRNSVKCADMIGIPGTRHAEINVNWRSVHKYMNHFNLVSDSHLVCSMDFVLDLQIKGLYKELFKNFEEVACITCRDVGDLMKDKLGFKRVDVMHTPPQLRPCIGPHLGMARHYPELYKAMPDWIKSTNPEGRLFLVGAGGMGKIYCMWIKQAGGIALDIGSIFDGWVGAITRTHLRYNPDVWLLR